MFLPSFSGGTAEHPGLLKYSCDLRTNVRVLAPSRVMLPPPLPPITDKEGCCQSKNQGGWAERLDGVLGGKPLLALAFDNMEVSFLSCCCS